MLINLHLIGCIFSVEEEMSLHMNTIEEIERHDRERFERLGLTKDEASIFTMIHIDPRGNPMTILSDGLCSEYHPSPSPIISPTDGFVLHTLRHALDDLRYDDLHLSAIPGPRVHRITYSQSNHPMFYYISFHEAFG